MLEEYVSEMMQCTSCSFCTVTCPVMNVLLTDASSPRGRVQIAYGLYTGELEPDKSVAKRLYECTTCGMCDSTCPSGVHIVDVIKAARKVVYPQLAVEKQKNFAGNISEKGHTYGEEKEPIWAFTGFAPKEKAEVAYFMGCKVSAETGHAQGIAAVNLLKYLEENFTTLDEVCCGAPLVNVGAPEEKIRAQMEKNLGEIRKRGVKKVLFSCPSCYYMFAKVYPNHTDVSDIEFQHIVEYLDEKGLKPEDFEAGTEPITYHDPCHLGRVFGVYDAPRNLIKSIPNADYKEMEHNRESSLCCGAGGSLALYEPSLTKKMADRRIAEAGERTIVSACPNCIGNFSKHTKAISIEELLWDMLRR